jgi:trimeric autotransporter adhesin
MDHLHERLEALEQRTHTVERQLRWWRGLASALLGLSILTWALPTGTAQEGASGGGKGLEQRVSALESLLKHFSRQGNEVRMTGANLHIRNGLGHTDCGTEDEPIPDCPNKLGNLIVGYNESRAFVEEDIRTGSHNVVVGQRHNFSRFGGLVVGLTNEISGDFAAVSGGQTNVASGFGAAVSGGALNRASELIAAVSGGEFNGASGFGAWVGGGESNTASGGQSSVSGGAENMASGRAAAVSGGSDNTASGAVSSVTGGASNAAAGDFSSVSGGHNRVAEGQFDWVAGSLFEDE